MGNTANFLKELNSHHNNFKNSEINIDNLVKSIEYYESFIPSFFSKSGEASGIKHMYESIQLQLDNEKTIDCVNLQHGSEIYKEYIEGMTNFIKDIAYITANDNSTELHTFTEKFNSAKERDSLFINSLYDGSELNPITNTVLSEAVSNIEFLIDFIPELNNIKKDCISIYESYSVRETSVDQLINDSMKMLYESVDNYCYNTISNIVTTYEKINDVLNNKTQEEYEPPKFELF